VLGNRRCLCLAAAWVGGLGDDRVGVLGVQVNGAQRSFQASMKRSMAAMRSATVGKLPRRRAWRVMIEKNTSTSFSQPEVGVECSCTRGMADQPDVDRGVLMGGVVVNDHVQLPAGEDAGDLTKNGRELLMAVPLMAGVGCVVGEQRCGGRSECFELDRPRRALSTGLVDDPGRGHSPRSGTRIITSKRGGDGAQ
jgi:hypothetical protein